MKRILRTLGTIGLIILLFWGGLKFNSADYKNRANERIKQVMELQEASEGRNVLVDVYDYKRGCWYQRVVFSDDPEITYDYEYTRSENKVRVWAMYHNMSLDLAHKQAKYPLYDVYFYRDKVKDVVQR
ncbi:DUF3139 domain-containing protein [Bacillus sp. MCCB 382]|uniref:DUF3139 domain-containing protein n=1 Tax=Bacillus sp. MCCB 382 TaxID=2860197 RepID=UPI001C57D308|nr:DUF3139 domain-containing protein [Bacillus sp. MCCB 382]